MSAHGYQPPQEQARYCHATSEAVLRGHIATLLSAEKAAIEGVLPKLA